MVKCVKVDSLFQERFGKVSSVGGLLPAEPNRFQIRVVKLKQKFGFYLSQSYREFVETSFCRCERNLLLQNNMQQSRETRGPFPQWGRAVLFVDQAEQRVDRRE